MLTTIFSPFSSVERKGIFNSKGELVIIVTKREDENHIHLTDLRKEKAEKEKMSVIFEAHNYLSKNPVT